MCAQKNLDCEVVWVDGEEKVQVGLYSSKWHGKISGTIFAFTNLRNIGDEKTAVRSSGGIVVEDGKDLGTMMILVAGNTFGRDTRKILNAKDLKVPIITVVQLKEALNSK